MPALVLVDHGSRLPEAHAQLERLAERVGAITLGWDVRVAHLEQAPPTLATAIASCARDGEEVVFVLPLFLAPGKHLSHDLPAQVERAAKAHPALRVVLLPSLGEAPALVELVSGIARAIRSGP